MGALKELASNLNPEASRPKPIFNEHFSVRVVEMQQGMHFNMPKATKTLDGSLNAALEHDIWQAGDSLQGRNSSASCFMTQWKMHDNYESFKALGAAAIQLAKTVPLALRTHADGSDNPIDYYVQESWGLIYSKGHTCKAHTHWPSVWSATYCVKACEDCAPLIFPNAEDGYRLVPKPGQLALFPSWVNHYVPEHTCDHERIMISINLDVKWYEEYKFKPDWAV